MRYRSFYPRDLFADLDRLQREIQQAFTFRRVSAA